MARRETRVARPQAAPAAPAPAAETQFNPAADQNLAEMAQRLEAALRRPSKPEEPRFAEAAPMPEADEAQRAPAAPTRPARADKQQPAGGKSSLYDSLEQEMASLLGRPGNKP